MSGGAHISSSSVNYGGASPTYGVDTSARTFRQGGIPIASSRPPLISPVISRGSTSRPFRQFVIPWEHRLSSELYPRKTLSLSDPVREECRSPVNLSTTRFPQIASSAHGADDERKTNSPSRKGFRSDADEVPRVAVSRQSFSSRDLESSHVEQERRRLNAWTANTTSQSQPPHLQQNSQALSREYTVNADEPFPVGWHEDPKPDDSVEEIDGVRWHPDPEDMLPESQQSVVVAQGVKNFKKEETDSAGLSTANATRNSQRLHQQEPNQLSPSKQSASLSFNFSFSSVQRSSPSFSATSSLNPFDGDLEQEGQGLNSPTGSRHSLVSRPSSSLTRSHSRVSSNSLDTRNRPASIVEAGAQSSKAAGDPLHNKSQNPVSDSRTAVDSSHSPSSSLRSSSSASGLPEESNGTPQNEPRDRRQTVLWNPASPSDAAAPGDKEAGAQPESSAVQRFSVTKKIGLQGRRPIPLVKPVLANLENPTVEEDSTALNSSQPESEIRSSDAAQPVVPKLNPGMLPAKSPPSTWFSRLKHWFYGGWGAELEGRATSSAVQTAATLKGGDSSSANATNIVSAGFGSAAVGFNLVDAMYTWDGYFDASKKKKDIKEELEKNVGEAHRYLSENNPADHQAALSFLLASDAARSLPDARFGKRLSSRLALNDGILQPSAATFTSAKSITGLVNGGGHIGAVLSFGSAAANVASALVLPVAGVVTGALNSHMGSIREIDANERRDAAEKAQSRTKGMTKDKEGLRFDLEKLAKKASETAVPWKDAQSEAEQNKKFWKVEKLLESVKSEALGEVDKISTIFANINSRHFLSAQEDSIKRAKSDKTSASLRKWTGRASIVAGGLTALGLLFPPLALVGITLGIAAAGVYIGHLGWRTWNKRTAVKKEAHADRLYFGYASGKESELRGQAPLTNITKLAKELVEAGDPQKGDGFGNKFLVAQFLVECLKARADKEVLHKLKEAGRLDENSTEEQKLAHLTPEQKEERLYRAMATRYLVQIGISPDEVRAIKQVLRPLPRPDASQSQQIDEQEAKYQGGAGKIILSHVARDMARTEPLTKKKIEEMVKPKQSFLQSVSSKWQAIWHASGSSSQVNA